MCEYWPSGDQRKCRDCRHWTPPAEPASKFAVGRCGVLEVVAGPGEVCGDWAAMDALRAENRGNDA